MRLSVITFTANGIWLSEKIAKVWEETEIALFTKCQDDCVKETMVKSVAGHIGEWAKEQMDEGNALLFIGACGIAVRAIAPHLTDKLQDSPVLVMDERGRYVIPILSGHVGGANELAEALAKKLGALPVVTTATDIHRKFAVDLFAKQNGLSIVNKDGIARVSSKILAGKNIVISVEQGHLGKEPVLPASIKLAAYPPTRKVDVVITSENTEFEALLLLRPKEYAVGVGCRKGKEAEKIEAFIESHLQRAGISPAQVYGMASIDAKKMEPGLLAWSRKERLPFVTYTAEELRRVEGVFHSSAFVEKQVGVDNVCERAALKMCGPGGRLVYGRHAEDGMTIAVAKREWRVRFDEE